MKKQLPINQEDFSKLREMGFYYVDKTSYVKQMVEGDSKFVFLSRPQRFGKSLLVDTIDHLFSGRQGLFEGLAIYDDWDWSKVHPVVRFDLSGEKINSRRVLKDMLTAAFMDNAWRHGVSLSKPSSISLSFTELFTKLIDKYGEKVVILIDFCHDPITDSHLKTKRLKKIQDYLRGFLKTLTKCEEYIHFAFLTDTTNIFSTDIYSGLTDITDISLDPNYAAICGYTEEELIDVFADEMKSIDLSDLRYWFGGYSWDGQTNVYHPYNVVSAFQQGVCDDLWPDDSSEIYYELINIGIYYWVRLGKILNGEIKGDESTLGSFEMPSDDVVSKIFQLGYLTVDSVVKDGESTKYTLKITNHQEELLLLRHYQTIDGEIKRIVPF